jgi:hypothetical protein
MRNRVPGLRRPWRGLLAAVQNLAGGQAELLRHEEQPWASVTFTGSRHRLALAFTGADAMVAGETLIAALPEHEFAIPRQLVAEATVTAVRHETIPLPKLTVECELLLLDDA